MFFKIAMNNVKRSFKDYSIYFLTLTFAVCIFYSFNSIEAQTSLLEIGKSTKTYVATLNKLIAGTSVFVSFILGGLIIYANNFLIKKRKKELGIYMTLGMSKGKISRILILETFLIGLLSLAAGVLLGIIVSQGLSVITAKLLVVDMNKYRFIVSISAIIKSSIYFGIIFLLVMIFNQIIISKYKLIDMLNATKKNEDIKLKNPVVSIVIFLLSAAALIAAYSMVLKIGVAPDNTTFMASILLGVIGTLMCFYSLSSFLINVLQKSKKIYLKNLNIFILRQINNKITTNFLSMTTICLMLFLTITLLFTMFGYKGTLDTMLKGNTSFDASAKLDINIKDQKIKDIKESLEKANFKFEPNEKHVFFTEYKLELSLNDLLSKYLSKKEQRELQLNYTDGPISAVKVSEYNSIRQLLGQQPVSLKDNEILVVSNYEKTINAFDIFMKNENSAVIANKTYSIKNKASIKENIISSKASLEFLYFIIPDNFQGTLKPQASSFNAIFQGNDYEKSKERFSDLFAELEKYRYEKDDFMLVYGNTVEQLYASVYGPSALIVFLGIYLGIVFLISSAAVLALQQLSEASDSLHRYNSLKKIGATEKMINKSILVQTLIYFMVPLSLAIIHSAVGITVTNKMLRTENKSIFQGSSLMIALALIVIYGGYFYATYFSFKRIVKTSN
ncbi:FtsX-like permease family protein [Clostridium sp. A1-XYC3]|uniref:FtsX-like permease family protein n=1 Tax=Clostridium tanneri TaxID=3037988 RepID=A0ABU4JU15_9CLOT|nr:FtsX-like permease family protein [Clostridium sp. A1-XYC3]MDW8801633.1 FtsX-like permease family protein [Clostridium sp. A1-XYC3]